MARTKQYFSTTCFKKSTKPRFGVTLSDKSDKIFDLTGKKKVSVMKFRKEVPVLDVMYQCLVSII